MLFENRKRFAGSDENMFSHFGRNLCQFDGPEAGFLPEIFEIEWSFESFHKNMLETDRLYLRKMKKTDGDAIFAMRSDPEVMMYIREPQSRTESLNWIKLVNSKWDSHRVGLCAVVLKETNAVVGWCGLWVLAETGEIEVGYAIAKSYWRRGFAFEAAEAALGYGFVTLGLPKIVACANPANQGSQAVMKKLGMTFDHIGKYYGRDLVHYTITREDWERPRFEAP